MRELGIKPYQANRIKNKGLRFSDELLEHVLELSMFRECTELVWVFAQLYGGT